MMHFDTVLSFARTTQLLNGVQRALRLFYRRRNRRSDRRRRRAEGCVGVEIAAVAQEAGWAPCEEEAEAEAEAAAVAAAEARGSGA